ncbi:MAG: NAD-dependent protein deacylase [Candidatus Aminicenantes bacterium]|nr:NAD-dependent protein deacylase [Candidatus Aminicenantes bacterium]
MINKDLILDTVKLLRNAERIIAFTGSGVSAESGIPTFRGKDGLWRQFRAQDLATPQAFADNPRLVWEWYDWRRQIISEKKPNPGHQALAEWSKMFPSVHIITQNIDGFHQKAGSEDIHELHGNIWKLRCTEQGTIREDHTVPLKETPPRCPKCGALMRPHVVWFGEALDMDVLNQAVSLSSKADVMFVVGTSALVYPAASIPFTALESGVKVIEINPESTPLTSNADISIRGKAGDVLPKITKKFQRKPNRSEEKEK